MNSGSTKPGGPCDLFDRCQIGKGVFIFD